MIDKNMIGERFTIRLDDGQLYSGCIVNVTETGVTIDASLHLSPNEQVVIETSSGKRVAAEVISVKLHGRSDIVDITMRLGDYL